MLRDKRNLWLTCIVSLATLATVASTVPTRPRTDTSLMGGQQTSLTATSLASASESEVDPASPVSASPLADAQPVNTASPVSISSASPVAISPARSAAEAAAAQSAAQQNGALRDGLRWTFGGKTQSGWAIYVPLIQHLLGTNADAATPGFAASLARWQKSVGLSASGVLNEATLMRMVSTWQAHRLQSREYPTPAQLLTVPAAEFYDPSRAVDLRQVERQTYAAYKRMLAAAISDSSLQLSARKGELAAGEKYLKIISAFRSREYQERLRKEQPDAGRAALAVNSPHFTGRALDLYVGGEPVITKDANRALQTQTRAYRWLVKNAPRFGFCPYFYEPWHWEYCAP